MDPLKIFPVEIVENILQFLSVSELLEASLVSKTWYEAIATSSKIMKNINLKLDISSREEMDYFKNIFAQSTRKYQNIEMKCVTKYIEEFHDALSLNDCPWKCVKITNMTFKSSKNVNEFLETFELTVEVLELVDTCAMSFEPHDYFYFDSLKVLKLKNVEKIIGIFTYCKNLHEFRVVIRSYLSADTSPAAHIIQQNQNLQLLETSSHIFDMIASIPMNFKLNTLLVTNRYMQSDFSEFIKTQMKSLQIISLPQVRHRGNVELIFQMPKLKEVNLGDVENVDFSNLQLHVNEKIEKLTYRDTENKFSTMKSIIKAAPNIKSLKLFSMTQEMTEFLSKSAKDLESIEMRTIQADDISNEQLFPRLKSVSVEIISSNFEDHIESITVEMRNNLARLLLASNYIILH